MRQKHFNLVENWVATAKSSDIAIKIATHEMLHETVNQKLLIPNTTFTEALFDVLCGRHEPGLWFAKECFKQISEALQ